MKIHIPNSAFLGNIDPFLKKFDPSEPDELMITANEKWISVHPVVLAMIAALGLTVEPSKTKCAPLTATSKHYLERMGLFKFLKIKSGINVTEHEPAGRFIPLTEINSSSSLTKFIAEITPLLHLSPKHAEPIKYVISELVRNVLEHSLAERGAIVSAQYHVKSNTIRIGIADNGVGIWKTISESHHPKTDLDALHLALTPGITGTTAKEGGTEFNAGAGLFFIKSMAAINRNFFMIYSGSAMYKLLKRKGRNVPLKADPALDRHSETNSLPFWRGTIVGIDLSLDATEEFSKLLDLLNTTYTQALRERKKSKYKKAKFI